MSQVIADQIVSLAIRYNTLSLHEHTITGMEKVIEKLDDEHKDSEGVYLTIKAKIFVETIYKYCSIDVATDVIEA